MIKITSKSIKKGTLKQNYVSLLTFGLWVSARGGLWTGPWIVKLLSVLHNSAASLTYRVV